jgi:hypothetical protein
VSEFIDPTAKTSPKGSFSMIENERVGLVLAKTGSINSGKGAGGNGHDDKGKSGKLNKHLLSSFSIPWFSIKIVSNYGLERVQGEQGVDLTGKAAQSLLPPSFIRLQEKNILGISSKKQSQALSIR